jgi:hypothetical protein
MENRAAERSSYRTVGMCSCQEAIKTLRYKRKPKLLGNYSRKSQVLSFIKILSEVLEIIHADGQISFIPRTFVGDDLFVNDFKFTVQNGAVSRACQNNYMI